MRKTKVNLSHYKLFSCNQGDLIPIGVQEVLPGDQFQHNVTAFVRVSPMLAPVMHPVRANIYHFFVPYRLLWTDWESFITGGADGDDANTLPKMRFTGPQPVVGTLADYMGISPPAGVANQDVSAMPFRAYNKIWNDWFRDPDLQTERVISLADGLDITTDRTIAQKCWEKDRFTTARPWPQRGDDVLIPMNAGVENITTNGEDIRVVVNSVDRQLSVNNTNDMIVAGAAVPSTLPVQFGTESGLEVDLEELPGTIRELRERVAIQRFRDRLGRGGGRYVDYLKSSFGVRSSDARLQRAELLSMGSQMIQFSEVLQTAPTTDGDDTEGVGNLKGHGIATLRSNSYRRFFEEHGVVISLMCTLPKTMYTEGTEKMWHRTTKEDFYDKDLALIGEEPVLNSEVFMGHTVPDGTFGWQQRYYDYRSALSSIAGEFRTSIANFWHMARSFSADVALNSDFVTAVPTDRIYAVTTTDQLYVMAKHNLIARRPIHRSSNPGIL